MDQSTSADGARLDFNDEMSYSDYLKLDSLLGAQHPLSPHNDHDEMLFIIQHQTTELWMKLMLHELRAARRQVRARDLGPAFKMMARVSRILEQLISMWDVLTTLTPSEYLRFRPYLKQASGFQSYQYRTIEFLLGNKSEVMTRPFSHRSDISEPLVSELHSPSLYDEAIRLLASRGFAIDPEVLERDWSKPYTSNESVMKAWLVVYRDPNSYWDLYELAEELVDLEDYFRQWRFRHLTTVTRVIGYKRGTGGTSGAPYLRQKLDVELFPELWRLRTEL